MLVRTLMKIDKVIDFVHTVIPEGTIMSMKPSEIESDKETCTLYWEAKNAYIEVYPEYFAIERTNNGEDLAYLDEFATMVSEKKAVFLVPAPDNSISGMFIFYDDIVNQENADDERKNRILMAPYIRDIAFEEGIPVYIAVNIDKKKNVLFIYEGGNEPEIVYSCPCSEDSAQELIEIFIDDVEKRQGV